jgi:hypothetical protein
METKFQLIASQASIAAIVAGIPSLGRVELLPLINPTESGEVTAARHGLRYIGIVSLNKQFQPRSAFEMELTPEQTDFVADEFVRLVERVLSHVKAALPDPRAN